MKYVTIPGTDMKVSQLQLGTECFGLEPSISPRGVTTAEAFSQLDEFTEAGGNFIDTALVYSDWEPGERSRSEKTIAKWLKDTNMRDKVYIATKGGITFEGHTGFHAPPIDLSKAALDRQILESCDHLGVDYIDLYWLHRDQRERPVGEIMETLNGMIERGECRYIGCSNWFPDRVKEANDYALSHGLKPFIGSQMEWSLARTFCPETPLDKHPIMDDEGYKFYGSTHMTAFAFSSQGKGFFTKLDEGGEDKLPALQKEHYLNDRNRACLKRIKKLSAETGYTITQISIAFIDSQKEFLGIPIVAGRTHEQFLDLMTAADVNLTSEQMDFLLDESI